MKICSPQLGLNPNSHLGGEVHDHFILQSLANKGNKIFVYLPKNRPYQKNKNMIVEYAPIKHIPAILFNLTVIPYLFRTYKREKFDILRIHNPYFLGLGALVLKLFYPNIPIITTYHLVEENPLYNYVNKLTAKRYDKIVCVSNYLKNWLIKKYGVDEKKIFVIYNGVDPIIKPEIKNKTLVKKYNLEDKFTILYMGLLIPRKNPMFLLEVFKQLKTENKNVSLLICGKGLLKSHIEDFIRKNNLRDVHLINYVYGQDKADIFNICDVFAFPSTNEGFGLVVAEAMTCTKPVIVADNSSLCEIVTDGKDGYLVELDVQEWVNKIKILINDNYLRQKIGNNGKIKSKLLYSWSRSIQKYETVLKA